jgi:energy-coupling factor transport system permease protein
MIDLYVSRPGWLHGIDPRVKLLFVMFAIVLLLVVKNLLFMLAVLAFVHVLYASARIPLSKLGFIWRALLPASLLMSVLWVIFYPSGDPLFQVWFVHITLTSLAQGLVLGLRILNLGLIIALWLFTTDPPSLVQSFVRLGIPFEWGLVLSLALRYIPFVYAAYRTISDAQQARGLNLSQRNGLARARLMLPILISMIISSFRASDQIAVALEARGFGARGVRRTSLRQLRFQPVDYGMMLVLLVLVLLLYLNLRFGFASQPIQLF